MRPSIASIPVVLMCPRCGSLYGPDKSFCPVDGAQLVEQQDEESGRDSTWGLWETPLMAGRYEMGEEIGRGSMARVYAARDITTGLRVAVKVLNLRYAVNEKECTRFFHEARAMFLIDHPNVVKVLDVGRRYDGRPFIVIEYLHGETLGDCLRRREKLGIGETLDIIYHAALGLAAVHRARIVHRDVKPDNIFLVGPQDAPSSARLVDFGLAKLHVKQPGSGTQPVAMGTAAYMPPEQVLAEPVDHRADIYSLGVVMFRCLTGHLPVECADDLNMLAHQVLLASPPVSWLVNGLNPHVDAVITRALRKSPHHRYPDMDSLTNDLKRVMRGLPIEPHPPVVNDHYRATTALGMEVTRLFCKRLGIEPMPSRCSERPNIAPPATTDRPSL